MSLDATKIRSAVAATRQAMDEAITAMGQTGQFRLRTGEVFSLPVALRFRQEQLLTDGISQDQRTCTFSASAWSTAAPAGQDPQKGDQVSVMNRRYAFDRVDPTDMGGLRIYWRATLKG